MFLQFAAEVGAITGGERTNLEQRSRRALERVATMQVKYQVTSDPAVRFISMLKVALSMGRAHLAGGSAGVPELAERFGWRACRPAGGWKPAGERIGWAVGRQLYLEPTLVYAVAQEMAGEEPFQESAQALRKKLRKAGLLASVDSAHETLTIRRKLEQEAREVLHVRVELFLGGGVAFQREDQEDGSDATPSSSE